MLPPTLSLSPKGFTCATAIMLAVTGCGSSKTEVAEEAPHLTTNPACVPSEATFEQSIKPALERNCTRCHTAPPQFGAPYPLLEYNALIAGNEGERIVDTALDELMLGTMPPGGQAVPHEDLDTLVGWLSCGQEHPNTSAGVHATQPVFSATAPPSNDYQAIDITADEEAIAANVLDDYRYFYFENLVPEDKFIRRIEALIDDSRVIHHITLQFDQGDDSVNYIYAWAPGTNAVELPGGLRLRPTDRLQIEIHYNNGAGATDVADSSGIRLYVDDAVGTEYAMLDVTTYAIYVAPHSTASAVAKCTADQEYTILAGMPHMHGTGQEFKQEIVRADGTREELFHLTGWSFEYQPFYHMPATINVGDRLETTCTYRNDSDIAVQVGEGTADEMCFNFLYVTPASVNGECREDNF